MSSSWFAIPIPSSQICIKIRSSCALLLCTFWSIWCLCYTYQIYAYKNITVQWIDKILRCQKKNFTSPSLISNLICVLIIYIIQILYVQIIMVFSLDGCSFHVAQIWCKQGLFPKKKSDLMTLSMWPNAFNKPKCLIYSTCAIREMSNHLI